MRDGMLIGVMVVAILVAACSTEPQQYPAPFAEIATSGPQVTSDPSGEAAVLTVETSIDAICAVSYGKGRPEGSLATDLEMKSGGHADHRVVLTGLRPDTEYAYRLQGVGIDGRLYQSEILSFRTPPAPSSGLGPNLAEGAELVGVSSEFSAAFAAENAVDGDLATEWSSAGDGDAAFIVIDLGQKTAMTAVAFRTREMSDGTAIARSFTLIVDGGEPLGPFPAGSQPVKAEATGRVLRLDVAESTGGNTGAVEVEVYGGTPGG